jgi:hypothetical protein
MAPETYPPAARSMQPTTGPQALPTGPLAAALALGPAA